LCFEFAFAKFCGVIQRRANTHRFTPLSWQPFNNAAWLQVLLPEPALIHFQCVPDWFLRAMRISCLRLHVLDINNFAIFIEEGDG
jgi:hypothetical protein